MDRFPKIRAAASWTGQHAPSDITRARAQMLAGQLTRCEAALGNGNAPAEASGLLRAVVLTVRDLAGSGWLEANGDDPAAAAFSSLLNAAGPPPVTGLDEIAAGLLWARFAPHGHPGTTNTQPHRTPPAGANGRRPRARLRLPGRRREAGAR